METSSEAKGISKPSGRVYGRNCDATSSTPPPLSDAMLLPKYSCHTPSDVIWSTIPTSSDIFTTSLKKIVDSFL